MNARILLVLVSLVASGLIGLALAARGGGATGPSRDNGIVIGLSTAIVASAFAVWLDLRPGKDR